MTRISSDYLGVFGFRECEVTYEVIRPGRSVELVELSRLSSYRTLDRRFPRESGVCRLATRPRSLAARAKSLPPRATRPIRPLFGLAGDYVASLDVRTVGACSQSRPHDGMDQQGAHGRRRRAPERPMPFRPARRHDQRNCRPPTSNRMALRERGPHDPPLPSAGRALAGRRDRGDVRTDRTRSSPAANFTTSAVTSSARSRAISYDDGDRPGAWPCAAGHT
jgi:hypothetical protein